MRNMTREIVKSIDKEWDIHDFRFVKGNTHTNLIFDVCVPIECKYTPSQIRDIIQFKLHEVDEKLLVVITVDRG